MFEIFVLSSSVSCYARDFGSYFACFICSMYILNLLELSKISIDLSVYVPRQKKLHA
jgi:hypothetical protein